MLTNLTSFKRHIKDVTSEHALFTNMKMRDMFGHQKRPHTLALIRFCIETMYEVATFDYKGRGASDFQLCTGATYLMIRLLGYIMKDQGMEELAVWSELSELKDSTKVPLGIKLALSIMTLLFKPGYTVRTIQEDSHGMELEP